MSGGEFDIIEKLFAPLSAGAPGAYGLTDDAALLSPPLGTSLVVTADAIVAGVHYLPDDPADLVARKLLRVNLSDLAAKGATPLGYILTAAFERGTPRAWIARFARGLAQDQAAFGLTLLGGDTVATPGPATFSATMFGTVPRRRMARRAGAMPGDLVCVTGTIGDGGFGLAECLEPQEGLTNPERRFLISRYRLPQPRSVLAPAILAHSSAAMDVSDGLVQDLGHLARASGVRLTIAIEDVPLSPAGLKIASADASARLRAMTAGDDYEIACTVPSRRFKRLQAAAAEVGVPLTVIGEVGEGRGVHCIDAEGNTVSFGRAGFDHFAAR